MNLNNAYKITLKDIKGFDFIQFIEADSVDEAIAKAKKTFHAGLYGLAKKDKSSISQKACKLTKEPRRLLFGFKGGHITIEANNRSVFDMLEEARNHSFVNGAEITEITSEMYYR